MTPSQLVLELQHCNNRNSECRESLLELCRAPAAVDEVNSCNKIRHNRNRCWVMKKNLKIFGKSFDERDIF